MLEKLQVISSTEKWLEMRETRNKIADEYLPEQIYVIYNQLLTDYKGEVENFLNQLSFYEKNRQL